jgi:hypothetical protein
MLVGLAGGVTALPQQFDLENPSSDHYSKVSLMLSVCGDRECQGSDRTTRLAQQRSFLPGNAEPQHFGLGSASQSCEQAKKEGRFCQLHIVQCLYQNAEEFRRSTCQPNPFLRGSPASVCLETNGVRTKVDLSCMRIGVTAR